MNAIILHPILTFLLFFLTALFIYLDYRKQSIPLNPKKVGKVIEKESPFLLDIRRRSQFDKFWIEGSYHIKDAQKLITDNPKKPIILIYDSELDYSHIIRTEPELIKSRTVYRVFFS